MILEFMENHIFLLIQLRILRTHAQQVLADTQANGITEFVHKLLFYK